MSAPHSRGDRAGGPARRGGTVDIGAATRKRGAGRVTRRETPRQRSLSTRGEHPAKHLPPPAAASGGALKIEPRDAARVSCHVKNGQRVSCSVVLGGRRAPRIGIYPEPG